MRAKTYVIAKPPVPWKYTARSGRRFFDLQTQKKSTYSIYLQQQHNEEKLFSGALSLDICFYMPCTTHVASKLKNCYQEIPHLVCPNIDDLVSFILDIMKDNIIANDNVICYLSAKKIYDSNPRTEFTIKEL